MYFNFVIAATTYSHTFTFLTPNFVAYGSEDRLISDLIYGAHSFYLNSLTQNYGVAASPNP